MPSNTALTKGLLALGFCLVQLSTVALSQGSLIDNTLGNLQFCFQQFANAQNQPNPDIGLRMDQVIARHGYPVVQYNVTTEDGYILGVYRIPYSPSSPLAANVTKKAIYLNHGLGGNGQNWILQNGDKSLGFMLADAGFDVFFSNCRGNSYSQGHVNLTTSDNAYWDFSWNEMGLYDVPAVMDLITDVTGNEKMYYAGHSMGTTQYFIAMSERPELNDRIHTAFLLAPIAYLSHSTNVIRLLAPLGYNGQYLTNPILGGKIDASQQLQTYTGLTLGQLCAPPALACGACGNLLFLLFGYDGPQTNYTNLSYELSTFPDTMSTKSLVHYAQSMTTGKFRKFDYGTPAANAARYEGQTSPPEYDLSEITAPTIFLSGLNDNLGVPADVVITASKLSPGVLKENTIINWALFNHMDFIIAIDADSFLYNSINATMTNGTYEN